MILIKNCNIFFKNTVTCSTSYYSRNLILFLSKSCREYVTSSNSITKVYIYKFSTNHVRNWSGRSNIEDFHTKIMKLNKSIDNKHVNLNILTAVIEDMENNNFNISQTLSIMLLHCCGKALYNEPLKIRQELVNRIWNLLKAKEYKLTIDHYHALLQTYIDNDYTIDSNQFLQNMTIFPEYDTYCLLLQVPSTDNCAFADSILLKIQQNTLPADKKIYNALMYAYAINGDIEKVHKIMELVQKETIEPLSAVNDIYLMYALAKNGDNKTLIKTLKNTKLSISDTLKLVKLLSLSKNDLCIKDILKCAQSLVTEEEEVCSAIALLVHAGHIMDAYKIAAYIPINTEFQNIRKILVLGLFKQIIKLNVDPETILKIVHNFKTKDFTLDIWQIVNQCALEENNDTLTFRILDEMKAMGIIINFDHVRPLCLHMQKCNNETDIYSIIRKMIALNNTINSDMIFLNYVFPVINTRDPIAAILKMQEHGIAPSCTVQPFVTFLLSACRLKECIHVCSFFKQKIYCQKIIESLFVNYKTSNDISSCIRLIFKLSYDGCDFAGTFIRNMINKSQLQKINTKHLNLFLMATKNSKTVLSPTEADYIKTKILVSDTDEKLKNNMFRLISDICPVGINTKENCKIDLYINPQYMNSEQLYLHFHELKNDNKNFRGIARKLLMVSCKENNEKVVEELLENIKYNNFEWTPGMKMCLLDFYVKRGMIEEALRTVDEIQCQFQHSIIDNCKILELVMQLVKLNKVNEACNVIQKCKHINHKPSVQVLIKDLFNLLVNNHPNDIRKMMNLLFERGYWRNHELEYLILAQILENNTDVVVNTFIHSVKKYKKMPVTTKILIELTKLTSDSSSKYNYMFQKIYTIIKQVRGKDLANVYFAIAFALCNKISELQHLVETNQIKEDSLLNELRYLKKEDIITITSTILETHNIISKSCLKSMYNLTLSIYDEQGDYERALELKTKMNSKYNTQCNL